MVVFNGLFDRLLAVQQEVLVPGGRAGRIVGCGLLLAAAALPVGAAPTTYLHETDANCLGNSPCYQEIEEALQNVNHGGTVIVLSDITGSIRSTQGRQNITLMGSPSSIVVNTQILLEEVVTGWTIKNLEMVTSCIIEDVAGSITLENVTANIIKIGDLTQDTVADIVVRDSTARGTGPLSVIGAPGSSLAGSVLLENNQAGATNVKLHVAAGPPTLLSADVSIVGNVTVNGGGVSILGESTSGSGGITGAVEYSNNVGTALDAKFGVITFGNVTGDISGPVTFLDNDLAWLALLTTGSIAGGVLGEVTMSGNLVEALEIVTNGGPIAGPLLIEGNQVLDLGGHTGLDNPLVLVDGDDGLGDATISSNMAPDADIVARAESGVVSGTVRMIANTAGLLTVDSRGGDFGDPVEVIGNFLPPSTDPRLSKLTIRALTGDGVGGLVSGNTSDELIINFEGFLDGDLVTTGNVVREQLTVVSNGNLNGATHTMNGNDFQGANLINGIDSTVQFNRFGGDVSVIQGTSVDATLNWWKCNEGPGAPGCSDALTAGFPVSPWLTFSGDTACSGSTAVATFDVLTASDASPTVGNVTPGTVVVTSFDGTVLDNPVELAGGAGCSRVNVLPGETNPLVQMSLDSEFVAAADDCTTGPPPPPCSTIFADGFESGDTSAWAVTVP
jgi:hypothetical protein